MILKTNNGETTHIYTLDRIFRYEWVETDHVVVYTVYGEVHKIPNEAAKGSVEASFHFYTKKFDTTDGERLCNVKRSGICFLNAEQANPR